MNYTEWPSPRSRNRPRVSRGERQEHELLESARRLLQHKLPSQLTVGAIAAEAGLSRSTVYFYFDSKESLIAATVEIVVGPMMREHEQLLAENGFTAALPSVLRILFATWSTHSGVLSGVMELVTHNSYYRRVWREYMEHSVELQASALERDRRSGLPVREDDPRAELLALCWMMERSCYMLFSRDHDAEEETHLFETFLRMFNSITGTRFTEETLAQPRSG
ncbi:AcrR family transcriptional regulator [Actinopolyspora biskrensis]|uniref:AcrR family transcriptional regulator n=1 Tax=Actinopolyspora biskrensis TaxID=1470178 RepID=A0A852Z949_9ACTN|nr:TetR/AcrR family transcriptional regulator [Actinopolyspora biskrensis]NYH79047.1 AcrR family transcriptional regulator [Actinopolyspora biskrensis]